MNKRKWKKSMHILICFMMLFSLGVGGFIPSAVKAADPPGGTTQPPTPTPEEAARQAALAAAQEMNNKFNAITRVEIKLTENNGLEEEAGGGYIARAGTPFELTPATVTYYDATNTLVTNIGAAGITGDITWSGTGVSGTTLNTKKEGITTVIATIKGGSEGKLSKRINIPIKMIHVPVSDIQINNIPMEDTASTTPAITINAGDTINLADITRVFGTADSTDPNYGYDPTYQDITWSIEKNDRDLSYSEDVAVDPITKQELKRVRITSDATVSTKGELNAKRRGQFVLKAVVKNGKAQTGTDRDTVKRITVKVKYVPVVSVERVPPNVVAGIDTQIIGALTGKNLETGAAEPPTYQEIKWEISKQAANTAGGTITPDGLLKTKNVGELTLRASVAKGLTESAPFVDDFNIKVIEHHIPVVSVKDVSTQLIKGEKRRIQGVVEPATASNNIITWRIVDTKIPSSDPLEKYKTITKDPVTGAYISENNLLTSTSKGTIYLMADIYYKEIPTKKEATFGPFALEIKDSFTPVTAITGVPTTAIIDKYLTLDARVTPTNADFKDIQWSIINDDKTGAVVSSDQFLAKSAGVATVRATILHGKSETEDFYQDFDIFVDKVFIPVTNISKVVDEGKMMSAITLSGTVSPSTATNKEIVWSVANAGTTGATVDDKGKLTAMNAGTVTVLATIKNGKGNGLAYQQYFSIKITPVYVPVKGLNDTLPKNLLVNEALTLQATVDPANATNKNITWSIVDKGTTKATLSGNQLRATDAGTVKIRATIKNGKTTSTDFTKDYSIKIEDLPHTPVKKIEGVPKTGWVNQSLRLGATVDPSDATSKTITWSIKDKGETGAVLSGSTIKASKAGTVKVLATIENGKSKGTAYTQEFSIVFDSFGGEGVTIKGNQIGMYAKLGGSGVASAKVTEKAVLAAFNSTSQDEPIIIVNLTTSRTAAGFSANVESEAMDAMIQRNVKSFIIQSRTGSVTLSAAGLQHIRETAKGSVSFKLTKFNVAKLPKAARKKAAGKSTYLLDIFSYQGSKPTQIKNMKLGSILFEVPVKATQKVKNPVFASLTNRGAITKHKQSEYTDGKLSFRTKRTGYYIVTNR